MSKKLSGPFRVETDSETGRVSSVRLYGVELLDQTQPPGPEVLVNGLPLMTRIYPPGPDEMKPGEEIVRLKGERFTDHFSGWALVVARSMGERSYAKHPCFGVHTLIRRENAGMTDLPCPGPGGPVIEAPLFVDTFSLMNWNWKFWGEDTRMVFPSLHSNGPIDEFGHAGYEHDTPENCKNYLQNVWRRIYPGVMGIHGGLFYNAETGHWIAITCRRPNVGYILNIKDAGRGVGYDFTLHAPFNVGDSLQMPEVKIYYGETSEEMWHWCADYITFYLEEAPAWFYKTTWGHGLAWNNKPTWAEQAVDWEEKMEAEQGSGLGYSLVTNRPVKSGTLPLSYEPDPNHGTLAEFRRMCRRMADHGIPFLVWMSHSGLMANAADFDDDWFIRGIDGRMCASWGSVDGGMIHVNPGHPGYIEYTKKWIRFYMKECGARGIFFDCLGWAFPPDYRPRPFMRYPGDTNRMAVKFMEEVYACIKECDPEGVMLGEGTTLEGPINIFSINSNPVRSLEGFGPRDFLLWLNQYSDKRIVIDQGPAFTPGAGMVRIDTRPGAEDRNHALTRLVKEYGGRDAFVPLPGDLAILEIQSLLIVPCPPESESSSGWTYPSFTLSDPWSNVKRLTDQVTGEKYEVDGEGIFTGLKTGIYKMEE